MYFDFNNNLQNQIRVLNRVNISLENFILKVKKKTEQFNTSNLKWSNLLNSLIHLVRSDFSPLLSLATWQLTDELEEYYLALDKEGNVFVDTFFFHSITNNTKEEVITYLVYLCISSNQLLSDLEIECFQLEKQFSENRKNVFNEREYAVLYQEILDDKKNRQLHVLALVFVNRIHYDDLIKISALEKGIMREKIGNREVKELLGLNDSDYKYMEKEGLLPAQMEQAEKIAEVVDREQISLEDYIATHLSNKKILLWNWWAISPFLIKDISLVLNLLSQYKVIKKIYIDLPQSINSQVQDYLTDKVKEEYLESFIKQVYPAFLKDYHKEISPYLIFLDRVKTFYRSCLLEDAEDSWQKSSKISHSHLLDCFGLTAEELLGYLPLVNKQNQIYFEIEENWHQLFLKEWQQCHSYREGEIVIFVQSLKPMFYLPSYFNDLSEGSVLERLIHTDKFTGFGPKKPANFLALYSKYYEYHQNSFVLPNIKNYFFADDIILPLNDHRQNQMKQEKKQSSQDTYSSLLLDDSKFNYFNLYDTLLYSNQHNNGHSSFVETDFKKDLVFY